MTFLNFTFQGFACISPDPSPLINYAGQWLEGTTNDSLAGRYSDGSFTVTQVAGSTATLTFTGTSVTIFGAKRPNHGNYTVTLDGGSEFFGDGNANNLFQFPLYSEQNLTNVQHTVVMTNVPTGQGPFLDVDFVSVGRELGPPGYTGSISNVTLDDESTFVAYNGSWSPSFSSAAFNSSLHGTTEAGASFSVFFQGSSIELYGAYLGAPFQVNLDNQLPMNLAGPNVPLDLQQDHAQTLLFFADGLNETETHVVTLRNSASSSGRPLFFDFAIVRSSQKFFGDTPSPHPDFTIPTTDSLTNVTSSSFAAVRQTSSTGAIVGGVIGGIGGLIILAVIGFILFRRSKYYPRKPPVRSAEDGILSMPTSPNLVSQFRPSTLTPFVLPPASNPSSTVSHRTKGSLSSIPVSRLQPENYGLQTPHVPPPPSSDSHRLSSISSSAENNQYIIGSSSIQSYGEPLPAQTYVLQEHDAGRLVQARLPPMYNDDWQGTAPPS